MTIPTGTSLSTKEVGGAITGVFEWAASDSLSLVSQLQVEFTCGDDGRRSQSGKVSVLTGFTWRY